MSYQAYNNEIEIVSVLLLDEDGNLLIDLAQETVSGKISLDYITFTESIGSPMLDGSLIYDCTKGEYEHLQLTGRESLKITAKSPSVEGQEDEETLIEFPDFSVYSFQDSSNISDTNKTPEGGTIRKLTLSFCSTEAKEIFEKPDLLPDGFIGKIATGMTFEQAEVEEGEEGEGEEDDSGTEPELIDKRGLVEIIAESIPGGIDAEPTYNDVWIKPKIIAMPSRKELEGMTPLQMINYCSNYAMALENPVAVNYFFWQDLDGFHFKSADLMLYEARIGEQEIKTFTVDSNIIGKSRIYGFDVIKDFSLYASLSNKALYSFYDRVEPDYFSSPYARLMDDREKFLTKKVIYNYKDLYSRGLESVEDLDPFYYLSKTDIEGFENEKLRVNDTLFGYHDDRAFNDGDSIRSVLLRGNDLIIGTSGDSGPSEEEEGEEGFAFVNQEDEKEQEGSTGPSVKDISHFNVYEPGSWQSMFDCMNLDGEILKKIITEIKQPTFEAKKKYRDMLAYKEQWNIYKYSVCCAVPDAESDGFMAILKGAQCIGRNIYQYSWNEVTFIPKVELAIFAGGTGETGDYSQNIAELNNRTIGGDNWNNLEITKFGVRMDNPITIGELSGEIVIKGTTCGVTFADDNSVTRVLENYLACDLEGNTVGVTFAFHNDKYSPFLVVEKPKGASGRFGTSSGAYNLNEILNRATYNQETYPDISGNSAESVLFYQAEEGGIEMPGAKPTSAETDVLVGPGINANKEYTDYPLAFASMPVGSYQRISRDENGAPVISTAGSSVKCEAPTGVPMGHIVKVQSLNTSNLPLYGIDIQSPDNKTIYYFNATNAQDGDCTSLIDCGIGDIDTIGG